MSSVSPEILDAIRELIRLDRELRELRIQQRLLDTRRNEQREKILAHYKENARFKTPMGDIVVRTREIPSRFTLEDIRDILIEANFLREEDREHLTRLFEEEAENKSRTTRTLSVRKPHTRRRLRRSQNKTAKQQPELLEDVVKED